MIKVLFASILEKAINSLLSLDASERSQLSRHAGKALSLKFTDINYELFFIIQHEKIHVHSVRDTEADVSIAATTFDLLRQQRSDIILPGVNLVGDVDMAHDVFRLLKNIDINWEDYLASLIGDFPTYHFSQLLSECKAITKKLSQRTIEDTLEFIQEEQRFIPTQEEVEDFYDDLIDLRNDIDRLEARLNRLLEQGHHENI